MVVNGAVAATSNGLEKAFDSAVPAGAVAATASADVRPVM